MLVAKDYDINLTKYLIFEERTALGFISVFAFHFTVITDKTHEAENQKAMSVIYLLANNFHCYNKY